MLLGFRTELNLNNKQRTLLLQHSGVARHAWNTALAAYQAILDHNKQNPNSKLKLPSAVDLHKWLVAVIKPANPWYYNVSKCAPQQAIRDLERAMKDFFKGKKIGGKRVGFPRFKKRGRHDSFYLDGSITCDHNKIKLPRIGWIRTFERLPHGYKPKNVVISRRADRWYVSFKIDVPEQTTPKTRGVIGVDLGINKLATCSDGTIFQGVKAYKQLEAKLARLQYLLRKKVKGSSNYRKAQLKIAKLHRKIANIRQDQLHKITTYLAKNHGIVVIEDLNIRGMLANRKLAKAIQDMGFYEFRRQLEYKTKLYGSEIVTVDRWFPSSKRCSKCHCVKDNLSLSDRLFKCDECGLEIDRDLNASINLEQAGSCLV